MTAKDIQTEFIKRYLKPTLKSYGYQTNAQTWWKNMGDFFIVINLQNSQWNSKEELSFCFNIGIAFTQKLKDPAKKKASYGDLSIFTRENSYLSKPRLKHRFRQGAWLGYLITENINLSDFTEELKIDFENEILSTLEQFKTLKDCIDFYSKFKIWGDVLKEQVQKLNLEI